MQRINFSNLPNQTTPINATNLNQLQTNVDNGKVDKDVTYWNADCNTCTTTGFYITEPGSANAPNSTFSFYLEVYKYSSTNILQRATARAQTSAIRQTYERQLINGTWTVWLQVPQIVSGEWTPTLVSENHGPTVTYSSHTGFFRRIGDLVYVEFYVRGQITALNDTNNYARVAGLPYDPVQCAMGRIAINTGTVYNCVTTTDDIIFCLYQNYISLQGNKGAAATAWKVTPSGGYFVLGGSGFYRTE